MEGRRTKREESLENRTAALRAPLGKQLLIKGTRAKKLLLGYLNSESAIFPAAVLSATNGTLGNPLLTALGWSNSREG